MAGNGYVETHDHGYVGHFHVRLTNFTRTCLASRSATRNTYVEVSCSLDAVEIQRGGSAHVTSSSTTR